MRYLKSIYCEICKYKLPFSVKIADKSYNLLSEEKPEVPYLVLEGIQTESREPGVYFISFLNKSSVILGRGHDSDVRIADISVSRSHTKIFYSENEFFIQDNFSKFGTLVMLEGSQVIEDRLAIQCGRSI